MIRSLNEIKWDSTVKHSQAVEILGANINSTPAASNRLQ